MESMEIVETLNPLDNRLLKAEEQNAREQKLEKTLKVPKTSLKPACSRLRSLLS